MTTGLMTEDRFLQLVAQHANQADLHTTVDVGDDHVDGSFATVVGAVLEVLDRHGPIVLTD